MAAFSRQSGTGWYQGNDDPSFSHQTGTGWVQQGQTIIPPPPIVVDIGHLGGDDAPKRKRRTVRQVYAASEDDMILETILMLHIKGILAQLDKEI